MKLQQQRAHADETGNREDADRSRSFPLDVDFPLGEMVKHGQGLWVCVSGGGFHFLDLVVDIDIP